MEVFSAWFGPHLCITNKGVIMTNVVSALGLSNEASIFLQFLAASKHWNLLNLPSLVDENIYWDSACSRPHGKAHMSIKEKDTCICIQVVLTKQRILAICPGSDVYIRSGQMSSLNNWPMLQSRDLCCPIRLVLSSVKESQSFRGKICGRAMGEVRSANMELFRCLLRKPTN